MLQKKLEGRLGAVDEEGVALIAKCREASEIIAKHYEDRRFNQAIVEICRLADAANEYFDRREPWKTVKTDAETTRVTLTAALNAFRIIAIYLKPILPAYADKAMKLFGETEWTWDSVNVARENCELGAYEYLASRIDGKQVEAMIAAATINPGDSGEVSHESRASKNKAKVEANLAVAVEVPALKPEIAFGDFEKVDLRIGKVLSCETVPKSSKLLKFELDAGSLGKRTIFSGIRGSYADPSALVGKEVLFVANLAPRKMSVGVSEGMILYAGEPGVNGGVLAPLDSVPAGTPAT
jgi:methionyl-tRNA synthetase